MINILHKIKTPDLSTNESEKLNTALKVPDHQDSSECPFDREMEFNGDFLDKDDISPHYNDGIVHLEKSIENLRKLLEIKQRNCEQNNMDYVR